MNDEKCCVVFCENPLDQSYWDNQYQANRTGWDLGAVSPPIKNYIDSIQNKNCSILIPGCGNTYEAEYLLDKGFTNISVIDIAPTLVEKLKNKFANNRNIQIILGDFFEHQGQYDLIFEQTFFCALPPTLRQKYVWKMHQILAENGTLSGLLFNRSFDVSPPFGGSKQEYLDLFKSSFEFVKFEECLTSVQQRLNSELFFEFKKNNFNSVRLYNFEGITCSNCKNTITEKLQNIPNVLNVSMSTDFSNLLIVSSEEIPYETLRNLISYDDKYKIMESN